MSIDAEVFGKEDVAELELAAIDDSLTSLQEKATASEAAGLLIMGQLVLMDQGQDLGFFIMNLE
ncbi:hypothetical protein ACFFHM_08665 [Halalkalibacter kiskunsagensis]|uniref:Uncharacterized protein n=1 Tax=Halalkalibacter kiskunsagensis TaxID=1548599 RepID=A0ABV6KB76_9BACI